MKGNRLSPPQIVSILRSHFLDKVPISDLCAQHDITPTTFYRWQKTFFENGQAAFAKDRKAKKAEAQQQQKVQALEAKLQRKDAVLAELMEEHVALKKSLGEP